MTLNELVKIIEDVLGSDVKINPNDPIMESGLKIDSLAMLRLFTEIEKVAGKSIDQEDAFELFGLSLNQIVERYS